MRQVKPFIKSSMNSFQITYVNNFVHLRFRWRLRKSSLKFANLHEYISSNRYVVNKLGLEDKGWSLLDEKTQNLLSLLKSKGVPLEEYVNKKVFYGIKTGLNEAFVISEEEKNNLIKQDESSKELIKPFFISVTRPHKFHS